MGVLGHGGGVCAGPVLWVADPQRLKSMAMTRTYDGLLFGLGERPVEVKFTYYLGRKSVPNRFGEILDPDDEPSLEIIGVTDAEVGGAINLNKENERRIQEELWRGIEEE